MKIFISHSSDDEWVARQIKSHIERVGGTCFLDSDDIRPPANFLEKIVEAIKECDELVVLLTPSSIERFWVTFEMSCFCFSGKPIVGVLSGLSIADAQAYPAIGELLDKQLILDINRQLDSYITGLPRRYSGTIAELGS